MPWTQQDKIEKLGRRFAYDELIKLVEEADGSIMDAGRKVVAEEGCEGDEEAEEASVSGTPAVTVKVELGKPAAKKAPKDLEEMSKSDPLWMDDESKSPSEMEEEDVKRAMPRRK